MVILALAISLCYCVESIFQLSLSFLCVCVSVQQCLEALRQLLPADTAMDLLSAYYNSSYNVTYSNLLSHFRVWLLSCLHLPVTKEDMGGVTGTDHMTLDSSWQLVDAMLDSKMLNSVPALKLFTALNQPSDVGGEASEKTPHITATHITSLEACRETVVYALHLVYEVSVELCFVGIIFDNNSCVHRR